MVRSRFTFAAVFALAIVLVAADFSDARTRRRARNSTNDTPVSGTFYAPGDGYVSMPANGSVYTTADGSLFTPVYGSVPTRRNNSFAMPAYSSNYRTDFAPNAVALDVQVPAADAQIKIDGRGTSQQGTMRRYVSPPLNPGMSYTYEVQATWMQNGEKVTRTRTVDVRPGQLVFVDLTQQQPTRTMPRPSRDNRDED